MQSILKRFPDHAFFPGRLPEGQARRVAIAVSLASSDDAAAVSGEALGRELGISRAAVQKHVLQLRDLGFSIAAASRTGYRLTSPFSDLVVAEAVIPYLLAEEGLEPDVAIAPAGSEAVLSDPPWVAGLPFRYVRSCASTNALLRETASSSPTGTVVVTDEQTGGRGRLGRIWYSEPGEDLTFSLLVRPRLAPAHAHLLSLAAALAVAETLENLDSGASATSVAVKWPNDVMLGPRKVCGILLEGSMDADRLQWAIIGIGLNVNSDPATFVEGLSSEQRRQWAGRPEPVSLRGHLGRQVPRAPLLAAVLRALTRRLAQLDTAGEMTASGSVPQDGSSGPLNLLEGIRRRDALAGHAVGVFSGPALDHLVVSGVAAGIGPEGQLLVRTTTGDVVPVFAGDVTLRSSVN
jgi:BirA family biotin operon repressor/biotin-[acetyl-CoA-carboxylase] ligase